MATLHTVNKSPLSAPCLESCLGHALDRSGVLLIEDGVYAAVAAGVHAGTVAAALARLQVFVLGPDLSARGLAAHALATGITIVDYDGFVDLVARYDKVQAWF